MFEQGNLLYFEPFIFKNGAKPKNKYMVVLGKDIDGNMILASLPTSKDHVPGDMEVNAGCLELPDRQVNVFVFPANTNVAYSCDGNAFSFRVNTFIYGSDLDTYPVTAFMQQVTERITKVSVLGKLTDEYMCSLIDCLKKSRMVKNKYKRLLTSAI